MLDEHPGGPGLVREVDGQGVEVATEPIQGPPTGLGPKMAAVDQVVEHVGELADPDLPRRAGEDLAVLGLAQGVGQALWEGAVYDDKSGQLLTGTMMDYAMPKADMLPNYETDRTVTPTPVNPLGIKGAGETGTIAATPAVVNAVVDALSPLGVDHIEAMPLTAARVWELINKRKG